MLKLAALFVTAIAALQCVVAERALKVEPRVAEMRVISSDANARLLKLGFNKAVAIDLPMDVKELLIADPQTVRVILRTVRRVLHCRRSRGTDQYLFLHRRRPAGRRPRRFCIGNAATTTARVARCSEVATDRSQLLSIV